MSRRCQGLTVKRAPCKAFAATGQAYCRAHDPALAPAERFGSPEQAAAAGSLGGRPSNAVEAARQLVEDNAVAVLAPHFRVLGYEIVADETGIRLEQLAGGGAKLYGVSKDGQVRVSRHDDLGGQMAAAEKLLDRAYGRPRQATELSGPGGGPVPVSSSLDLSKLSRDELLQLKDMMGRARRDGDDFDSGTTGPAVPARGEQGPSRGRPCVPRRSGDRSLLQQEAGR